MPFVQEVFITNSYAKTPKQYSYVKTPKQYSKSANKIVCENIHCLSSPIKRVINFNNIFWFADEFG